MSIKIIDRQGREIGCIEKKYLIPLGLKHQIVRVIVYAPKSDSVLLQHRSLRDDSCPGMWDTSASGHVDGHEDIEHAALRELKEELGVEASQGQLRYVGSFATSEEFHEGRLERETHIYCFMGDKEFSDFRIKPLEVEKADWLDLSTCLSEGRNEDELRMTKGAARSLSLFDSWLKARQK